MSINFNDTTPAAPAGSLNTKWQKDGSGNTSVYVLGATGAALGVIQLTNDLGGTAASPSVVGLQGHPVDSAAPTDAYVLTWVQADNKWEAKALPGLAATVVQTNQANTYTAGDKQTFAADATHAGLALAGVAVDPSTLVAGDIWYRTDIKKISFHDGTAARTVYSSADPVMLTGRTVVNAATYTVLVTDRHLGVTYTATGAATVTLYDATTVTAGTEVIIKDEAGNATANNITVNTTSAQTIDGAATATINANYGVLRLYSDGANWQTF